MIRWGKEGGVNGVKARERMREDIEEDPARIYGSSGKRRRYQKLINGNYPQDEALENALTRSKEKLSKDVILVLGYEREREQRAILISPSVRSVFSLKLSSFLHPTSFRYLLFTFFFHQLLWPVERVANANSSSRRNLHGKREERGGSLLGISLFPRSGFILPLFFPSPSSFFYSSSFLTFRGFYARPGEIWTRAMPNYTLSLPLPLPLLSRERFRLPFPEVRPITRH